MITAKNLPGDYGTKGYHLTDKWDEMEQMAGSLVSQYAEKASAYLETELTANDLDTASDHLLDVFNDAYTDAESYKLADNIKVNRDAVVLAAEALHLSPEDALNFAGSVGQVLEDWRQESEDYARQPLEGERFAYLFAEDSLADGVHGIQSAMLEAGIPVYMQMMDPAEQQEAYELGILEHQDGFFDSAIPPYGGRVSYEYTLDLGGQAKEEDDRALEQAGRNADSKILVQALNKEELNKNIAREGGFQMQNEMNALERKAGANIPITDITQAAQNLDAAERAVNLQIISNYNDRLLAEGPQDGNPVQPASMPQEVEEAYARVDQLEARMKYRSMAVRLDAPSRRVETALRNESVREAAAKAQPPRTFVMVPMSKLQAFEAVLMPNPEMSPTERASRMRLLARMTLPQTLTATQEINLRKANPQLMMEVYSELGYGSVEMVNTKGLEKGQILTVAQVLEQNRTLRPEDRPVVDWRADKETMSLVQIRTDNHRNEYLNRKFDQSLNRVEHRYEPVGRLKVAMSNYLENPEKYKSQMQGRWTTSQMAKDAPQTVGAPSKTSRWRSITNRAALLHWADQAIRQNEKDGGAPLYEKPASASRPALNQFEAKDPTVTFEAARRGPMCIHLFADKEPSVTMLVNPKDKTAKVPIDVSKITDPAVRSAVKPALSRQPEQIFINPDAIRDQALWDRLAPGMQKTQTGYKVLPSKVGDPKAIEQLAAIEGAVEKHIPARFNLNIEKMSDPSLAEKLGQALEKPLVVTVKVTDIKDPSVLHALEAALEDVWRNLSPSLTERIELAPDRVNKLLGLPVLSMDQKVPQTDSRSNIQRFLDVAEQGAPAVRKQHADRATWRQMLDNAAQVVQQQMNPQEQTTETVHGEPTLLTAAAGETAEQEIEQMERYAEEARRQAEQEAQAHQHEGPDAVDELLAAGAATAGLVGAVAISEQASLAEPAPAVAAFDAFAQIRQDAMNSGLKNYQEMLASLGALSPIKALNAVAVHGQMPEATLVRTREQWAQMGYAPQEDAKALTVEISDVAGHSLGQVFDISQVADRDGKSPDPIAAPSAADVAQAMGLDISDSAGSPEAALPYRMAERIAASFGFEQDAKKQSPSQRFLVASTTYAVCSHFGIDPMQGAWGRDNARVLASDTAQRFYSTNAPDKWLRNIGVMTSGAIQKAEVALAEKEPSRLRYMSPRAEREITKAVSRTSAKSASRTQPADRTQAPAQSKKAPQHQMARD